MGTCSDASFCLADTGGAIFVTENALLSGMSQFTDCHADAQTGEGFCLALDLMLSSRENIGLGLLRMYCSSKAHLFFQRCIQAAQAVQCSPAAA